MANDEWRMLLQRSCLSFAVLLISLLFPVATAAQSCNPAVINYIVRDETGKVLTAKELKAVSEQLPAQIGDAQTSVGETSFAPDYQTYYWNESTDWEKGIKQPSLQFANASICALRFGEITLVRANKRMRLIFNIEILRFQEDRRPVIDSLPFQSGTFRLDLRSWTHDKDKIVPASRWKRIRR